MKLKLKIRMLACWTTLLFLGACTEPVGTPTFLGSLDNEKTPNNNHTSPAPSQSDTFEDLKNPQSIQKLIYHVGPVDLLANSSEMQEPKKMNFQVDEPVWVIGFEPKVIDSKGNKLPGALLQKALILNKSEENPICSSGSRGNPFAVATSTLTKIELPEGYGYPLLPQETLEAEVVFKNSTDEDFTDVIFSFELTAIPMEKGKATKDVQAMLLDHDPCEHKPLAIEPGAYVEKNKTFTVGENGALMIAHGLLSDYGVSVSLSHSQGSDISVVPFWRAEATLDEDHQIVDLTNNPFFDPQGKELKTGDKLTLGTSFDNFSEEWQMQATGGAMIYLAPTP